MTICKIVTGCAGFIGSNLVDRLLENLKNYLIGIDNYSTRNIKFITKAKKIRL